MNLLVTGASGCVGHRVVRKILQAGSHAYAVIRDPDSLHVDLHPNLHVVQGDLTRSIGPPPLPRMDAIIHCAALTPGHYQNFSQNVTMTKTALYWSEKLGAPHFILVSSIAVLGELVCGEKTDFTAPQPDTPYAKSKLCSEKEVIKFCQGRGSQYTILRPGIIYGPHDRGAILQFIKLVEKGLMVRFGSGTNQKSMTSVETLADTILETTVNAQSHNQIFMVVDSQPYTINEIIDTIASLANKKPLIVSIPTAISLALCLALDLFRWVPFLTALPQSIRKFMIHSPCRTDKWSKVLKVAPSYDLKETLAEEFDWYRSMAHR